jgi:hypothetical protein
MRTLGTVLCTAILLLALRKIGGKWLMVERIRTE